MMHWRGFMTVMAVTALAAGNAASIAQAASFTVPTDGEIRSILMKRIDVDHQSVGIVVGVVDRSGRRIVAYGARNQGDPTPLDGASVFEIGSMTKVFTSLLLEEAVLAGSVALDDPVEKYLPPGVHVPTRNGKAITLIDLATHTSGLPRMPTNFKPSNPGNPYADYTDDQLFSFLSGYTLQKDVGVHYEYSNLGAALLGQALARRAGLSYEALAKRDIIEPLHMTSTAVTLTPSMKSRMTVGHDAALAATPYWDLPTFAGAGALRSDTDDMLTFLGAELGYVKSPLAEAMRAQSQPRRPTGRPGLDVSLAWHVRSDPGGEIIWHNGGTGGYRTFMGFNARAGVGVVVLTNAATEMGGDDIGFHLLTGSPLTKAPKDFKAIELPSAALEPFVGRYEVAPIGVLAIRREGDSLLATAPDKTTLTMTPESPTSFFVKLVNAEIAFDLGADGKATGFVLHQNGSDLHGRRIP